MQTEVENADLHRMLMLLDACDKALIAAAIMEAMFSPSQSTNRKHRDEVRDFVREMRAKYGIRIDG